MAAFLVLLAIAAISIYLYRDSIARNVANSVLQDSELAVTGLAINSITADNIYFAELELGWSSGARIRITGIVLPTQLRKTQPALLNIDQIELFPAGKNDQPPPIAAILTTILELPQNIPYSTVQIGRVTTAGLPPLTDVSWESTDNGQLLQLDIGSFDVAAGIELAENGVHRVSITATTPDDIVALALALGVERADSRFNISGQSTTRMAPLLPVLQAMGMVPARISAIETLLRGAVSTSIPDNPQDPIRVDAMLQSDGGLSFKYQLDDQAQMQIQVLTYAPTVTMVEYPSLDWRVQVASGAMKISTATIQDFPLSVTSLTCQAGIVCTLQANIAASNISLGGVVINSASASVPMTVTIDEQMQVLFAEDMTALFHGVRNQQMIAESIALTQFAGATLYIDDNGWRGMLGEARFRIEGITVPPGFGGSLTTTLSNLAISDNGDTITGAYHIGAAEAQLSLADLMWLVPDIAGTWKIANGKISATATVSSADDAIQGRLKLSHDLNSGEGKMQLRDALIDFSSRSLSKFLSPAPKNWDTSAGRLSLDTELDWLAVPEDYNITGSMRVGLAGLDAYHGDIALTGLSTELRATINTQTGHVFEPTTLSLDLLDVGLPIDKVMADFRISKGISSIQIDALSMGILGGTLRTDPFNYSLESTTSTVLLRLDSIQLSLMMALAEFDSIDIEGSVSGVLPITIVGNRITIDQGRLKSDEPGGSIRYRAGGAGADDSQLGLVTRALSDFEFTTLTSDVTYLEDGKLLLAMRLEGVNPKMDPNQPVVLNLNVENNVPEMLRSLQATRSIQEILERRLNE